MSDEVQRQIPIQSVSRAIAILKCFSKTSELGLSEISNMVGLHKSTAAGIINTLKIEGFLEQNEKNRKLRLGLDLFSLAVRAKSEIYEICEPYLNTLLDITGETVNLAVLDKTEVVYIAKKESKHSVRISSNVGARFPIYCSAIGKSILSAMDREKAESIIENIDLVPWTTKTITDKEKLLEVIDKATTDGVAYDFEEFELGVICIASPLCATSRNPVGAISISGPQMRMDEKRRLSIVKIVKETAEKICGELARLAR